MRSAPSAKPDYSLPELDEIEISLEEFREAYPTWLQWRQTDKRFLPTELRKQPQPLFDNILYMDTLMEKIIGQAMERIREQEAKKNG